MSSISSTPHPVSPPKPSEALRVKPNPHPYAIKTTSTGILSGSHAASSTVSSTSQSPYRYVPASPSPSPTKPTQSHGGGSKHRYSRSLTSDELPRPLPIPPSPSDDDDDHDVFQSSRPSLTGGSSTRIRRSETLPSGSPFPRLSLTDDPTNPKQWNPAELAAHLGSTLDADSGLPIDEITAFIEDSEITGMSFLRFDDGVLNAYGVDPKWRPALLSASRTLRQNVLRMGLPSSTIGPSSLQYRGPTTANITKHNRRISRSANSSPTRPFTYSHPRYSTTSTASSAEFFYPARGGGDGDDEEEEAEEGYLSSSSRSSISSTSSLFNDEDRNITRRSRHKHRPKGHGRVRGMVASFERSNSLSNEHNQSPTRYDSRHGRERERERNSSTYDEMFPTTTTTAAITPTFTGNGRPLPKAPQLVYAHTGTGAGNRNGIGLGKPPLLLPQASHSSASPYASALSTPNVTGNGNLPPQHTGQRPLPVPPNDGYVPLPLSLSPNADRGRRTVSGSTTSDSIYMSASEGDESGTGKGKEMTMQGLLDMLGEDADVRPDGMTVPTKKVAAPRKGAASGGGGSSRTAEEEEEDMTMDELLALTRTEKRTGAEAWEIDYGMGETVKRVPVLGVERDSGRGSGSGSGRIGRSLGRKMDLNFGVKTKTKGKGREERRGVGDLFAPVEVLEVDHSVGGENLVVAAGGEEEDLDPAEIAKEMEREMERERERLLALEVEQEREREAAREHELLEREREREQEREREWQLQLEVALKESEQEQRGQERRILMEEREREYARVLEEKERERGEMRRELEREREEGEKEEMKLVGEIRDTKRGVEELRVRVEEVERRVGELEEREREREERERERKKEEEEERRPRDEGGISQTVLRNMKMLVLACSISLPALLSSSSRSTSRDSPAAVNSETGTDAARTRNGNGDRPTNSNSNQNTNQNRVTRRHLEQLYDSLPRYVLFFGIGACAFVLRGLVRRVWALGVGVGVGGRGVRAVRR